MARIEKTVFISYRRKDISWALAVYQYLTSQKYDVFFDYTSIPSGDFEQIIVSNIKARAHFVLILTPTALDRCSEPNDWLRREIEMAMDEKRNIIPLFFDGFSFSLPTVIEKMTDNLATLKRYNGLDVPSGYFSEAMERLRARYLNTPLTAVIHPVSTEVHRAVLEEQRAANIALSSVEYQFKRTEKKHRPDIRRKTMYVLTESTVKIGRFVRIIAEKTKERMRGFLNTIQNLGSFERDILLWFISLISVAGMLIPAGIVSKLMMVQTGVYWMKLFEKMQFWNLLASIVYCVGMILQCWLVARYKKYLGFIWGGLTIIIPATWIGCAVYIDLPHLGIINFKILTPLLKSLGHYTWFLLVMWVIGVPLCITIWNKQKHRTTKPVQANELNN